MVLAGSSHGKYAGLCVFLFGSYISAPLTVAWLSNNTPGESPHMLSLDCTNRLHAREEPGKRALVLGVNGFGNLAGVIGSQLYRQEYAPDYQTPFYVTLGFVAAALLGYLSYRITLESVNRRRAAIRMTKTPGEIDRERTDQTRYSDNKFTFAYGL